MLSIALLVIGVVLLVMGVAATDSFSSNVSETFQGVPSDKAIYLLVGGGLCTLVGLGGLFMRRGVKA